MTPNELSELKKDSLIMFQMRGGTKEKEIAEEDAVRDFAFATVVATKDIKISDEFSFSNTWPKRPGTGEIPAREHNKIIGKISKNNIKEGEHIRNIDF